MLISPRAVQWLVMHGHVLASQRAQYHAANTSILPDALLHGSLNLRPDNSSRSFDAFAPGKTEAREELSPMDVLPKIKVPTKPAIILAFIATRLSFFLSPIDGKNTRRYYYTFLFILALLPGEVWLIVKVDERSG